MMSKRVGGLRNKPAVKQYRHLKKVLKKLTSKTSDRRAARKLSRLRSKINSHKLNYEVQDEN